MLHASQGRVHTFQQQICKAKSHVWVQVASIAAGCTLCKEVAFIVATDPYRSLRTASEFQQCEFQQSKFHQCSSIVSATLSFSNAKFQPRKFQQHVDRGTVVQIWDLVCGFSFSQSHYPYEGSSCKFWCYWWRTDLEEKKFCVLCVIVFLIIFRCMQELFISAIVIRSDLIAYLVEIKKKLTIHREAPQG